MTTRAAVAAWSAVRKRAGGRNRSADAAVVKQIQREAREHGATLANGGKGGLDPRLALKAFRASKWRCRNTKCPSPKKNLSLDHQSGHPKEIREDPGTRRDRRSRAAARDPDPKDDKYLHCLCEPCHDRVHDRERAIEDGKKPRPMRGDRR